MHHAERVVDEYKKFLWLCKVEPEEHHGMAGAIDLVWHDHILHTRAYASFCASELGRFLHHTPAVAGREAADVVKTAAKAAQLFGDIAEEVWQLGSETDSPSCGGDSGGGDGGGCGSD